MLDKIREGSQGTIAKVILGAVILSFAFAGIGSYLGRPAESTAAVVNGQSISTQSLESAVRNERQRLQQQMGDSFERIASNPGFMQQVRASTLDRLVVEVLLDQVVAESKLQAGDEQVRNEILAIDAFKVNGQFSNDSYLSLIQRQGFSVSDFREYLRNDISRRQLMGSILNSEFVLPNELTRVQQLLSQTRDIRYWQIDLAELAKQVTPTEEQIQAYYDGHQFAYQQPEMVSVQYVELNAEQLAASIQISDQEVESYYNENAELFKTQEERRASHILLTNDADGLEKAKQIQTELAAGSDFSELVKTHSVDTFSAENGGDLDWLTSGVMGDAFDQAVFSLQQEGDVSETVTSPFGLHIIKLTGIRPAQVKVLADVTAEIKARLSNTQALDKYYELQEVVTNVAYEVPDSLEQVALESHTKVQVTDLFHRDSAPAVVADPRVLEAIFSDKVRDGLNSDPIEVGDGHLLVVRQKEQQPARVKTLDEVKAQVSQAVKIEQAGVQAKAMANEMLARLAKGEQLIIETNQPVKVLSETAITRNNVTLDPAIRDQVFAMAKPDGSSQYGIASANSFIAVIALDAVTENQGDVADESLKQRLQQQMTEQAYLGLVNVLKANADIQYPALAKTES